jgi:hypothetical protein
MKTTADQILERQFSSDTGLEEPSDAIKSKVSRPSRMTKLAQARAKLCPVLAARPSVLPSACSFPVASRTRFHLQLGVAGSIQHTVGSELSTMDGSLLGVSPVCVDQLVESAAKCGKCSVVSQTTSRRRSCRRPRPRSRESVRACTGSHWVVLLLPSAARLRQM